MKNNLYSLLESLLNEGKLEDFYLKQKERYPSLLSQISYLEQNKVPANYASWIIKQINVDYPESVKDILPLIFSFEKNKGKLGKKDLVFYKNASELNRALEDLNQQKQEKQIQKTTIKSSNIQDVLIEKDGWYVVFPHTTDSSCDLGSNTTWCTARTQSGNMFLNYVGIPGNMFLFYVINPKLNPRKNLYSKMVVSFYDETPHFNLGDDSSTVNANNKNLTQEKFEEIVGSENASLFLNAMSKKAKELEGVHPAEKEMESIADNYDLFLKKMATYKNTEQNNEAKKEFVEALVTYYNPISRIVAYIIEDYKSIDYVKKIKDSDILEILSKSNNLKIRKAVAENPNTKPDDLLSLANDPDRNISQTAISNKNYKRNIQENKIIFNSNSFKQLFGK